MITILHDSTDPYFNLALEEYLLKEYDTSEDIFYVWRNQPSIIIGRNQNPYHEINFKYAEEQGIPIIRRVSGGGTVIHDLGNINFTYITSNTKYINNYKHFVYPIMLTLNNLGLDTKFVPNSHIYLDDHKISGNAQSIYKGKMIHHGTILYDMNLENAKNCIKNQSSIQGHFVVSTKANITNIKEKIAIKTDVDSFMNYLRDEVLLNDQDVKQLTLDDLDRDRIQEMVNTKYKTLKWNYGHQMTFDINNDYLKLEVKSGTIIESSIPVLINQRFSYKKIKESLKDYPEKERVLESLF